MSTAKINFEIDQESLANAKAYVAKHGGSLNKLVASLFASLGQDERLNAPAIDPAKRVLLDASAGRISIVEAAALLGLPDAGYVLRRLADERLPPPRLADSEVRRQADESLDALKESLLTKPAASGRKRKAAAASKQRAWQGC